MMNALLFFLYLVFIFSVSASTESCPDGWMDTMDLGCLYFGLGLESSTWLGASSYCEDLHPDSSLIEIFSQEENDLLSLIANLELEITGADAWWIGLDDIGHEGEWFWESSSTPASYFSWADNRPNNDPSNRDDCVYMAPSPVGPGLVWTDANCDYEDNQLIIAPLCQIRTISSTTSTITTTTSATGSVSVSRIKIMNILVL